MITGKVIKGEKFDWSQIKKIADPNDVLWYAAATIHPGTIKCPGCQCNHWKEGEVLECGVCHTWFDSKTGATIKKMGEANQ